MAKEIKEIEIKKITKELNDSLPEYIELIKQFKKGSFGLKEKVRLFKLERDKLKKRRRYIRQERLIYVDGCWVKNE